MDRANMNKCKNNSNSKDGSSQAVAEQAMAFTYFYASTYFEAVKIFLIKRPKDPLPDGYFTSFLVLLSVVGIFSCLTFIGIARMTFSTRPVKKKRRRFFTNDDLTHSNGAVAIDVSKEVPGSILGTDLMANSNSQ